VAVKRSGDAVLRVVLGIWAAAPYAISWLGYLRIGS
jgi:hypothetical protein